jgi:hypothetical protein
MLESASQRRLAVRVRGQLPPNQRYTVRSETPAMPATSRNEHPSARSARKIEWTVCRAGFTSDTGSSLPSSDRMVAARSTIFCARCEFEHDPVVKISESHCCGLVHRASPSGSTRQTCYRLPLFLGPVSPAVLIARIASIEASGPPQSLANHAFMEQVKTGQEPGTRPSFGEDVKALSRLTNRSPRR